MTNRPAGPPPVPPSRPAGPPSAKPSPRPPATLKTAGVPSGTSQPDGEKPARKSSGAMIGYLISGGIVLAIVAVVVAIMMARNSIGTPTKATTAAGRLDHITLSIDISAFLPAPPEAVGGNALDIYRSVIADAKALCKDGNLYLLPDIIKSEKEPEKNPNLKPILDKLVKAGETPYDPTMDLTFPDVPVNPKVDFSVQKEIRTLGLCLMYAAMSTAGDKKFDEAEKYIRAEYAFGLRLWNHGAYMANRSAGLSMISDALVLAGDLYRKDRKNDPARQEAAKAAYEAFKTTAQLWKGKEMEIVRNASPIGADLWNLAHNDKDRTWRIQGIMWLGVAKWTPGNSAKAIDKYLQSRADDKDRIIAEKAKEALAFTEADKNSIEQEPD